MADIDIDLTITGLQEAQAGNARTIAEMRPTGAFGRAIKYGLTAAERYAISITHVDTGALRASHRIQYDGDSGMLYLDPHARNPRSGELTSVYGWYEHQRGGSHAFYARTYWERGAQIGTEMGSILLGGLP